ncbi:SDR family NAD(P)-dependent oxidoreductase [Listeria booriae]|uniref:SDR family NAD(P)-dependent oxidoreductase n=1 Tax=Listeria booriae TaxID=1552123 RepID=UPI00290583DF|nr:SDR family NAD(P)-dependent oxidoreductase [Listeria booriae]
MLVTGTSKGIGKEIEKILQENPMNKVYGAIHSQDKIVTNKVVIDLMEEKTIGEAVASIILKEGKIDVLINNAAIFLDNPRKDKNLSRIDNIEVEVITKTIQTNYFGALSLTKAIINTQLNKDYLRIINISSGMGRLSEIKEYAYAYSVSKLLLNTMTIAYSNIFSEIPKDFAMVSICPGWVKTDMGTQKGLINTDTAAKYICSVIEREKADINGKFLRYGEELDWYKKV